MGIKDCVIKLDNQWNTYYPGQTVNGVAEFTFDSTKKVRGISVKVKGACNTKWSEMVHKTVDGKMNNVQVDYTGEEEYFSTSYYILGSKSGNEIEIPAGTHSYPFTCVLPPTLPSSFEGEFGHVRYTIKITLDRPWKFDQDMKMAFTVVSHMDLNFNPDYRLPLQIHKEKTFCCCWCKSGPLIVDVNIPVSAFCSGQWIPADVSIENGSNVKLNDIVLKLIKTVTYRVRMPSSGTKTSEVKIVEVKLGPVPENTSKNWQEFIQIPPLPPSNLVNCSLIDLDYKFLINCSTSGLHSDVGGEKVIILGTVPLEGFYPAPPPGSDIPSAPTIDMPELPLLPDSSTVDSGPNQPQVNSLYPAVSAYPNMAQPVFQEGQFAAQSIHDSADNENMLKTDFAPRYPTYGFVIPPRE